MNTLYYTAIVKKYSTNLLNVSVFPLSVLKESNLFLKLSHKVSVRIQYSLLHVINTRVLLFLPVSLQTQPRHKALPDLPNPVQMCWSLYSNVYVFLSAQLCLSYGLSRDTSELHFPAVFCTSVANKPSEDRKLQPWLVLSLPMWLLFLTACGYFWIDIENN